jgi:CheY-like chemotaxis protein
VKETADFALHGSPARCAFDVAPDLWAADVDRGQVAQVVQNLVINAGQAMPEGGIVRIGMRNVTVAPGTMPPLAGGRYLRLSFSDSGGGIRPEHLARVFEPYFTTKAGGAGLGLATVYSIAKKHHGHVAVESQLGRGTTFHLWLPAAQQQPAATTPSGSPFDPMCGRVLFMDDEEGIRTMVQELLARVGLEIVAVPDGAAAIAAYEQARKDGQPFDVVVMDLTVPGAMGGREAMERLLVIDPQVKAIVSSGYSKDPVLANHRAHGFRGMVPKPYRVADLTKVLREVLAMR